MLAATDELAACGASAIAVGFSPAPALSSLAAHLAWSLPFLADEGRVLYERLGFGRATRAEVFNPGTKERYRQAAARGVVAPKPVEDPLQLGGDAVIGGGRVLALFRTASPDGRVPVPELLAAVRRLATG